MFLIRYWKHQVFLKEGLAWILILSLIFGIPIGVVWATDYYVATDGDNSNDGSSTNPFLTIEQAITAATTPGDTIRIEPGTYTPTATLTPGDGVHIRSNDDHGNLDAAVTIIDSAQDPVFTYATDITNPNSTIIEGLTINSTTLNNEAILVSFSGATAVNISPTITDNIITTSGASGFPILIGGNGADTVLAPTITGNSITSTVGIRCNISNNASSASIVTQNDISTDNIGIDFYVIGSSTGSPTVSQNTITGTPTYPFNIYVQNAEFSPTITGNTLTNGTNSGLYLHLMSTNTTLPDLTITGNTITGNTERGIWIKATYVPITISSGLISGNTISSNGQDGIFLDLRSGITMPAAVTISNNTITGNSGAGIHLFPHLSNTSTGDRPTSSPTITQNTITGNNPGIKIYPGSAATASPVISHNVISSNTDYGISIVDSGMDTADPIISHNTITNNTNYGIYAYYNGCSANSFNPDLGGGGGSLGQNTISGNTTGDFYNSTFETIVANDNWWSTSPPTQGTSGEDIINADGGTWDITTVSSYNSQTLSYTINTEKGYYAGGDPITFTAYSGTFFVDEVGVDSGANFNIQVDFDNVSATSISVANDGQTMTAVTPAGTVNSTVDVVVTNPAGQTGTLSSGFTFLDYGFTVSTISENTTESGNEATFTVVLLSQPNDDVTTVISSDDTTEGTVSPASLTFTSGDWDTPQTVTVTGIDDDVADGNISFQILLAAAVSNDANYDDLDPADVNVINEDDETIGIITGTVSDDTTEAGGTATFNVRLNSQPTAAVTVSVASSDLTEGTVSPGSLSFTTANWNTAQTVTVTGVDDGAKDGDITFIISLSGTSSDNDYNNLSAADISLTNKDDDTVGISTGTVSGSVTEAGGAATFDVSLTSQPTADVTVTIESGDTSEGTLSPESLVFTTSNWNTAQTLTVTGVDDDKIDGDVTFTVSLITASDDENYDGLSATNVNVINEDDDTPGLRIGAVDGNTTEDGQVAAFTVSLRSIPSADVNIKAVSSDVTEGTVKPKIRFIEPSDWDVDYRFLVSGVDDEEADGDVTFTITLTVVSEDPNYADLSAEVVSVINEDNDSANNAPTAPVLISPTNGTSGFDPSDPFSWRSSVDDDGDNLTYHLYICEDGNFEGCTGEEVAGTAGLNIGRYGGTFTIAGGSLCLFGFLGFWGFRGRKRIYYLTSVLLIALVLTIGCTPSGDGDDSNSDTDTTDTISKVTTKILTPGTTYYWGIVADDNNGGETPSAVWSFTVQN